MKLLKVLPIIALAALVYSSTYVYAKDRVDQNLVEAMTNSFHTGCMGGIVAVIENGYYDRREDKPLVAFGKMKKHCEEQTRQYYKYLGGK